MIRDVTYYVRVLLINAKAMPKSHLPHESIYFTSLAMYAMFYQSHPRDLLRVSNIQTKDILTSG